MKTKSFDIPKQLVWEAYQRVSAKKGAAGCDGQTIEQFQENVKGNLYKLWNRLSSGSYLPPPVRTVAIPKKAGGERRLGIPTVSDRIAQMTVLLQIQPLLEPHFDKDSYGFRPNRSALDAVAVARTRCWKHKWVIDLDIKAFFDRLDHKLLMKAVRKHTKCRWVILYIERWLKAPIEQPDGTLQVRETGVPQGGVISPLLANLFLHYTFDKWMRRQYSDIEFARYADDVIIHCRTRYQAERVLNDIKLRMKECMLELHPQKTKIVYCGNEEIKGSQNFDFLGYTFRRRLALSKKGKGFVTFLPAVSNQAKRDISQTIKSWRLHRWTNQKIEELARRINPVLRGWMNYYGKFYQSALSGVLFQVESYLRKWCQAKFKTRTGKGSPKRARKYLGQVLKYKPYLFEHWRWGLGSPTG